MTELQAIDDFITTSAGQLDVTEVADVSVVVMIDDQAEFERAYPQARTKRDGVVYPRRVHRVAAARRAHSLEAAGGSVRIAVAELKRPAPPIYPLPTRHRGGEWGAKHIVAVMLWCRFVSEVGRRITVLGQARGAGH